MFEILIQGELCGKESETAITRYFLLLQSRLFREAKDTSSSVGPGRVPL